LCDAFTQKDYADYFGLYMRGLTMITRWNLLKYLSPDAAPNTMVIPSGSSVNPIYSVFDSDCADEVSDNGFTDSVAFTPFLETVTLYHAPLL